MRRVMVRTDEHRDVLTGRALDQGGADLCPHIRQARPRTGERGADLVPVRRQMPQQDLFAVTRLPAKEVVLTRFAAETPPQDAGLHAEFASERREDGRMAERVRRVQDVESAA